MTCACGKRVAPDSDRECFDCRHDRWASVAIDHQKLSTRDHVRNNMERTKRIIKQREEVHMARTDLRVERRGVEYVNHANIDGNRPRHDEN